jgi:hypothetical protein
VSGGQEGGLSKVKVCLEELYPVIDWMGKVKHQQNWMLLCYSLKLFDLAGCRLLKDKIYSTNKLR